MRRRGFTLIELLVVVAIIGLLIAIVVPSLKLARAQANEVVCRSNLHQIDLSLRAYTNVYKGYFPLAPLEINPHQVLLEAVGAKRRRDGVLVERLMDAFYCPQASRVEPYAQDPSYPPRNQTTSVIDTRENRETGNVSYFYWSHADRSAWRSTNHDRWDEPMDSFRPRHLRVDGPPIPLQPSDPETPCALQSHRKGQYWVLSDFFRKRAPFPHHRKHKGGLNVLYLDGHGGWMRGQPRANFK